jgi:hypothetical protein
MVPIVTVSEGVIGRVKHEGGNLGHGVGKAVDIARLIQNEQLFNLLWDRGLRPVSTAVSPSHAEH